MAKGLTIDAHNGIHCYNRGGALKVAIRRMGNSQGVLIPKPLLAQVGP